MTRHQMMVRIFVVGTLLLSLGIVNIFLTAAGHQMLSVVSMGGLDILLMGYLFFCLAKYIKHENR